nr:hypothetical protein [Candidatus Sigynarchaeota archaeon]
MISYQLSLLNFIPGITPPDPRKDLIGCKAAQKHWKTEGGYTAELRPGNVIEIKESRCKICGMRLVRIGANKREPILDDNFGKHEFIIRRKRCKRCGEKTPDLHGWVEKGHVFQESFKRKARQLHAQGFNVAQIKKSFSVCNNIEVSRSIIQEWIDKPATQLRALHESTKLPTSGHVHNDETFPKIWGVQHYLQMTIAIVYGLVLGTTTVSENTKSVTKRHLRQVEETHKFKINTVMSDGTKKFGREAPIRARHFSAGAYPCGNRRIHGPAAG